MNEQADKLATFIVQARKIFLPMLALATVVVTSIPAFAEPCPKGEAVDEQEGWEFIANNAARTADAYAVEKRVLDATPAFGQVRAYYQLSGEFKGEYLVAISHNASGKSTFMMLHPNFEFCSDPKKLDDEREDLFSVVVAKHNGFEF